MRIGIYSGTFDPIHEGHMLFAEVACEQFGLDKVMLIVEPNPRHKNEVTHVSARNEMILQALKSAENPVELLVLGGSDSHTVNGIIFELSKRYPDDEYYFLMGSDVFSNIGKWGERADEDGSISEIASSVAFIVGLKSMSELKQLKQLSESLALNTRFIEIPIATLSSTKIRQLIAVKKTLAGLNDDVIDYITKNNLYR